MYGGVERAAVCGVARWMGSCSS